jgi:hypothetical protein
MPRVNRHWVKPLLQSSLVLAAAMAVAGVATPSPAADKPAAADAKKIDFAKDIQPILKESCVRCHGQNQGGPGRGPGGAGGPPRALADGGPGGPGRGPGMRGPAGGLRLDDQAAAMKGGKHGKAIVPGKAEDSLLFKLLKGPAKVGDDEIAQMPKGRPGQEVQPLPDEKIALIKQWIDQGAKWTK